MKSYLFFLAIALFILIGASSYTHDKSWEFNPTYDLAQDTLIDMKAEMAKLQERVKGREQDPAEEVFDNIQMLKGMPAGRIIPIMRMAFNRSLGVQCDHCHTPGQWDSDTKSAKQVTRDMWAMVGKINRELLPGIENLQSDQPVVNCTTCHRGDIKPAISLPQREGGSQPRK